MKSVIFIWECKCFLTFPLLGAGAEEAAAGAGDVSLFASPPPPAAVPDDAFVLMEAALSCLDSWGADDPEEGSLCLEGEVAFFFLQ